MTNTTVIDKGRIALATERLNQSLMFRIPWRRRRQLVKELRANLEASSAEQGSAEAVRQLGDMKVMINEYLEAERGRVDVAVGIFAAGLALVVVTSIGFFGAALWTDAIRQIAPLQTVSHSYGWMTVDYSPNSFGVEFSGWATIVFPLAMFLLFSRIWRLFTTRRPA